MEFPPLLPELDSAAALRPRGLFVTGTDTEVGKTTVTAGLAHGLVKSGLRVAAIKPVAAGLRMEYGRMVNDDVLALFDASNAGLTEAEVGPLQLREPCAPHIAAQIEGRVIERTALLRAVRHAAARADAVLVEGVGGWEVPLAVGGKAPWSMADFATELGLPVLLVVGMRLGCLNHAVLTVQAIRARGLPLAGWVANQVLAELPHAAAVQAALEQLIDAPCVGRVPHQPQPTLEGVAAGLDVTALRRAVGATA